MPEHNNRRTDSFFHRYVLPSMIGLAAAAASGAFTMVWGLSTKVALIEQRQLVRIEDFVRLQTTVDQQTKEIERLREWMKNHVRSERDYLAEAPAAAVR